MKSCQIHQVRVKDSSQKKRLPPIVALASGIGRSGIAVIRVSGFDCHSLISTLFSPNTNPFYHKKAIYGRIKDIDDVIILPFLGPNSYTGEDVIEIHCHGNPLIIRKIIACLVKNGIEPANPGEFTRRAFLNGKMDISSAEAVHEIITARNEAELQNAERLKSGRFREELNLLRTNLLNLTADLTAELDFVSEDIQFANRHQLLKTIRDAHTAIKKLLDDSKKMTVYRNGFHIAIIGPVNSGKSSLLNALAGKELAIVSDIPGTTRDSIEIQLQISGIDVHFTDTAGIRELEKKPVNKSKNLNIYKDPIEKIGIDRSLNLAKMADLILIVLDSSKSFSDQLKDLPSFKNTILVLNKIDLKSAPFIIPTPWLNFPKVKISAINYQINSLLKYLESFLFSKLPDRQGLLLAEWQNHILENIITDLTSAEEHLECGIEISVSSLHTALNSLAQLTGEITTEDLLEKIFSRFCIGK